MCEPDDIMSVNWGPPSSSLNMSHCSPIRGSVGDEKQCPLLKCGKLWTHQFEELHELQMKATRPGDITVKIPNIKRKIVKAGRVCAAMPMSHRNARTLQGEWNKALRKLKKKALQNSRQPSIVQKQRENKKTPAAHKRKDVTISRTAQTLKDVLGGEGKRASRKPGSTQRTCAAAQCIVGLVVGEEMWPVNGIYHRP